MAENEARLLSHPFFCCIYFQENLLFFPMPDRLTGRWEESDCSVFNHKVCSALFRNCNLKMSQGHTDVCAFSDYVHKTFMDLEQFGTILTRQAVSTWKLKVHILSSGLFSRYLWLDGWWTDKTHYTPMMEVETYFECRNCMFLWPWGDTWQRFCPILHLKLIVRFLSGKFSDEHCSWLCSTFSLKDAQFSSSKLVLLKTGTNGPLLCKKKLML